VLFAGGADEPDGAADLLVDAVKRGRCAVADEGLRESGQERFSSEIG
jgi:hypothetical protein